MIEGGLMDLRQSKWDKPREKKARLGDDES